MLDPRPGRERGLRDLDLDARANTIGAGGAVLTTVYGLGHSLEKGVSIDGRQS